MAKKKDRSLIPVVSKLVRAFPDRNLEELYYFATAPDTPETITSIAHIRRFMKIGMMGLRDLLKEAVRRRLIDRYYILGERDGNRYCPKRRRKP